MGDVETALSLVIVMLGFMGYLWVTRRIGYAAEAKGRSFTAWALIAMFFGLILPLVGLVIPAIMVAAMKTDSAEDPDAEGGAAEEASGSASQRLRQLNVLYEEGLLSQEEYAEKRRSLLDRL